MNEIKIYEIGSVLIDNYNVDDFVEILLSNGYIVQIENMENDKKLITIKTHIEVEGFDQ